MTHRIRRIVYLSEAACLVESPRASAAVISITEPGRTAQLPSPDHWGALLRVQFMDAEFDASMLERSAARGDFKDLCSRGFPCRERCSPILAFLDHLAANAALSELIVHCHAGQRRSAAVAKFAAERFGVPSGVGEVYNRTVYALLHEPDRFDQVLRGGPNTGWIARLAGWMSVFK